MSRRGRWVSFCALVLISLNFFVPTNTWGDEVFPSKVDFTTFGFEQWVNTVDGLQVQDSEVHYLSWNQRNQAEMQSTTQWARKFLPRMVSAMPQMRNHYIVIGSSSHSNGHIDVYTVGEETRETFRATGLGAPLGVEIRDGEPPTEFKDAIEQARKIVGPEGHIFVLDVPKKFYQSSIRRQNDPKFRDNAKLIAYRSGIRGLTAPATLIVSLQAIPGFGQLFPLIAAAAGYGGILQWKNHSLVRWYEYAGWTHINDRKKAPMREQLLKHFATTAIGIALIKTALFSSGFSPGLGVAELATAVLSSWAKVPFFKHMARVERQGRYQSLARFARGELSIMEYEDPEFFSRKNSLSRRALLLSAVQTALEVVALLPWAGAAVGWVGLGVLGASGTVVYLYKYNEAFRNFADEKLLNRLRIRWRREKLKRIPHVAGGRCALAF